VNPDTRWLVGLVVIVAISGLMIYDVISTPYSPVIGN
jgi:hypothetical protein